MIAQTLAESRGEVAVYLFVFQRIECYLSAGFHINEFVRAVFKIKIEFGLLVHHMKEDDIMLGVPEMLQRREYLLLAASIHHIAKNKDKAAFVRVFSHLMQTRCNVSAVFRVGTDMARHVKIAVSHNLLQL